MKRKPRGTVARYWFRAGLREAAEQLMKWSKGYREEAQGMQSEYDDPGTLYALADTLYKAGREFEMRAKRFEPKGSRQR